MSDTNDKDKDNAPEGANDGAEEANDAKNANVNNDAPVPQDPPAEEKTPEKDEMPENNAYYAQDERMKTLPQDQNHYNMGGTQGNWKSSTHNDLQYRHTFQGHSIGRENSMRKYARMSGNWNNRFHVSPSINNDKSHTFYKQFFDKPTRSTQGISMKPKKVIDPYLENETKSRIPRYSKLYKERDVHKEFSWIDNFSITHSKNNNKIHGRFKEYFDKPVNYNGAVTVATTKGVADAAGGHQLPQARRTFGRIAHVLLEERGNKYSKNRHLEKSLDYNGMIPFLRDHDEKYTMGKRALKKMKKQRTKSLAHRRIGREYGWHKVGFPISMHNEKNHMSKKLGFEDL